MGLGSPPGGSLMSGSSGRIFGSGSSVRKGGRSSRKFIAPSPRRSRRRKAPLVLFAGIGALRHHVVRTVSVNCHAGPVQQEETGAESCARNGGEEREEEHQGRDDEDEEQPDHLV